MWGEGKYWVAEVFHEWVTGEEAIPNQQEPAEEEPLSEGWGHRIHELAAKAAALSNGARWNGRHFANHLGNRYEVTREGKIA